MWTGKRYSQIHAFVIAGNTDFEVWDTQLCQIYVNFSIQATTGFIPIVIVIPSVQF